MIDSVLKNEVYQLNIKWSLLVNNKYYIQDSGSCYDVNPDTKEINCLYRGQGFELIDVIDDQSQNPFLFIHYYGMSSGLAWDGYLLIDTRTNQINNLFRGNYDGEFGGYGRGTSIGITEKGLIEAKYELKDINQDLVSDIVIKIIEEHPNKSKCSSTVTYVATPDGFVSYSK